MDKENLIRKAPLFADLSLQQLAQVVEVVHEVRLEAGQMLFQEGTAATALFLIALGDVEILKINKPDVKFLVAELGPGSHFGEMPFVDGASRAASAVAKSTVVLLEVRYDDLRRLMANHPYIGQTIYFSIARTLCSRIRQTTTDLASVLLA